MKKNLPFYDVIIEEEDGDTEINFVALVSNPAIQRDFMAFSNQRPLALEVVSEERRILSGPLMLADTPIYRKPPQVPEEGYVVFSKQTIETMVQKFFRSGYQKNINLFHDSALQVDGVVMFESWIVDRSRGILPMQGFEDAPDGSWFGSFKVDNEAVWEMVKQQDLKGFSIEGVIGTVKQQMSAEEQLLRDIQKILEALP
jgi:Putative phage serine protease XkdF